MRNFNEWSVIVYQIIVCMIWRLKCFATICDKENRYLLFINRSNFSKRLMMMTILEVAVAETDFFRFASEFVAAEKVILAISCI